MNVAIVDCGSGNLRSVAKAVERAGSEASLNVTVGVTTDPEVVRQADRIVLPGQGAFRDCRRGLSEVAGLEEALVEAVTRRAVPFLGICVGMQLMVDEGLEHGVTPGLSWIGGQCAPMTPSDRDLKIPHMGWNNLTVTALDHPVLDGVTTGDHVYFVHSYAVTGAKPEHVLATADYGGEVVAIIGRDTMIGTQFHVEKSQAPGLRLIGNFLRWKP